MAGREKQEKWYKKARSAARDDAVTCIHVAPRGAYVGTSSGMVLQLDAANLRKDYMYGAKEIVCGVHMRRESLFVTTTTGVRRFFNGIAEQVAMDYYVPRDAISAATNKHGDFVGGTGGAITFYPRDSGQPREVVGAHAVAGVCDDRPRPKLIATETVYGKLLQTLPMSSDAARDAGVQESPALDKDVLLGGIEILPPASNRGPVISMSANNAALVTCSHGETISVYDPSTALHRDTLRISEASFEGVTTVPGTTAAMYCAEPAKVSRITLGEGSPREEWAAGVIYEKGRRCFAHIEGAVVCMTASYTCTIDHRQHKIIDFIPVSSVHPGGECTAIAAQGNHVYIGTKDGSVHFFDMRKLKEDVSSVVLLAKK